MALIACYGIVVERALQNAPTFPLQTISTDPVQQKGRLGGGAKQSCNCQALSVVGMALPTGTGTSCMLVNDNHESQVNKHLKSELLEPKTFLSDLITLLFFFYSALTSFNKLKWAHTLLFLYMAVL